jgi:hypothetical protein
VSLSRTLFGGDELFFDRSADAEFAGSGRIDAIGGRRCLRLELVDFLVELLNFFVELVVRGFDRGRIEMRDNPRFLDMRRSNSLSGFCNLRFRLGGDFACRKRSFCYDCICRDFGLRGRFVNGKMFRRRG